MSIHRNELHGKIVSEWEKANGKDLSAEDLTLLYAKAIQAVEKKSLITLSSITVLVVVDRSIHEAKLHHPFLTEVKATPEGVNFSRFLKLTDLSAEQQGVALRELLIDLLNVLGNITADILTSSLHSELFKVNKETKLIVTAKPILRAVDTTKKGQGQK